MTAPSTPPKAIASRITAMVRPTSDRATEWTLGPAIVNANTSTRTATPTSVSASRAATP